MINCEYGIPDGVGDWFAVSSVRALDAAAEDDDRDIDDDNVDDDDPLTGAFFVDVRRKTTFLALLLAVFENSTAREILLYFIIFVIRSTIDWHLVFQKIRLSAARMS
jgi:hypothetical protein